MKILAIVVTASSLLTANDEFFEQRIRPVLVEKCYGCHNSKLKSPFGGLRLDTAVDTRKGGDSGPALVPGKPEESRLYTALLYEAGAHLKMPPTGKLPANVIADFKTWIAAGAPDPRTAAAPVAAAKAETTAKPHWAFQPLRPGTGTIDDLLGTKGKPAIGRREWLRRITFDLTGLPPKPAEIEAFLKDSAPDADRTVMERLLASPHYGERWARHWLDLVRYCETNGHEFDNDKIDAWKYRDYVIRAFNDDVPYDQLIREHVAGDLLAKPRLSKDGSFLESPIGSGMLWFGEVLNSATDSVKTRTDVVDNQLDVISKTFLGMTLACARCHDHKFDPLPTREYYGVAGVLHSTYFREAVVDSPARDAEIAKIRKSMGEIPHELPVVQLRDGDQAFTPVSQWRQSGQAFRSHHGAPEFVGSLTSEKFVMPKFWIHLLFRGDIAETNQRNGGPLRITLIAGDYKSQHMAPKKTTDWQWKSIRMTLEHGRTCYFEVVDRDTGKQIELAQVVFSDHPEPPTFTYGGQPMAVRQAPEAVPPSTWAMISQDENPHDVKVHVRGSHQNLGDVAPRGFLKAVKGNWAPVDTAHSGRLEFADWIASPENPLTARVLVNRVWKHHFGTGLVKSVDNFGKMGDPPANVALLDSLARGFMDHGWSIKWLHREILQSAAYRGALPVRRLEAEAIRDSILAVSGRLDPTLYGKSVPPVITAHQDGRGKPPTGPLDGDGRRSIYIEVRRNFLSSMFLAFDYPLPISTIGGRGSSTVPSQALLMMNNEFVEQQAKLWADRVTNQQPDAEKRVAQMYEEAFGRLPSKEETRETLEFAKANSWADLAHVLFNSAEFLYVQ
ncbi:hypothetical protein F183_A49820 [Bryobacterales bacterium F-183]|nr:hypothetical protein F183_A49820 [Bryobacterales bacterium F-183]